MRTIRTFSCVAAFVGLARILGESFAVSARCLWRVPDDLAWLLVTT